MYQQTFARPYPQKDLGCRRLHFPRRLGPVTPGPEKLGRNLPDGYPVVYNCHITLILDISLIQGRKLFNHRRTTPYYKKLPEKLKYLLGLYILS